MALPRHACRVNSVAMTELVTSITSAARDQKRISAHIGAASPCHVYDLMYSGMCVWYDTT